MRLWAQSKANAVCRATFHRSCRRARAKVIDGASPNWAAYRAANSPMCQKPPQSKIPMKAHAANLEHRGVHGPNRDPKLTCQFVAVDCFSPICGKPGVDMFDNVKAVLEGTCAPHIEQIRVEKRLVESRKESFLRGLP